MRFKRHIPVDPVDSLRQFAETMADQYGPETEHISPVASSDVTPVEAPRSPRRRRAAIAVVLAAAGGLTAVAWPDNQDRPFQTSDASTQQSPASSDLPQLRFSQVPDMPVESVVETEASEISLPAASTEPRSTETTVTTTTTTLPETSAPTTTLSALNTISPEANTVPTSVPLETSTTTTLDSLPPASTDASANGSEAASSLSGSLQLDCGAESVFVERGMTLWLVSEICDIDLNLLIEENSQIPDPNLIFVGETIQLSSVD